MKPLSDALDHVGRPLRGMSGLARMLAGVAAAISCFAVGAWLARIGVVAPVWVLLAWLFAMITLAAGLMLARRVIRSLGPWHVGERLETLGAWRKGALTTVLDPAAAGTSASLHAAAESQRAAEVLERAPAVLAPQVDRERHLGRRASFAAIIALAVLAAARPVTGMPSRLWNPIGAWNALMAPVRLTARTANVARGEAAILDVTAIGHRRATLYTRAPGEAWQASEVDLDIDGKAVVTTAPLSADLVARVEAGGRRSDEVRISLRLAAFLGAFSVVAHYPAYLGLDAEALPVGGDTLVLPEGTRLAVTGRATTPLGTVKLQGPGSDVALTVDGAAFHGDLTPRSSGIWHLAASPANGGVLEGEAPVLPIRIVPDSVPAVEIALPGADTVAPPSMSLPVVVSVRDDHGITSAGLDTRRGSITLRIPLALPPGMGDRALIPTTLDLGALGLKAGDTLHYSAMAEDNAPGRHVGRSKEFFVRIPTDAEQRAARARETASAGVALDSLAANAARVQRTAEDLARERQRGDAKNGDEAQRDPLSLEQARKAEATAQSQEKVLEEAAKLQKDLDQLRQAAERQGLADSTLAAQLAEIRKLLDKALTPELRDKLEALREALKNLDADKTREALQDMAKRQEQLKDAIEQAKELFKRAALETDLANAEQESKQIAEAQKALTEKLAKPDSGKNAADERALAQRTDSLAAALDRAAKQAPADSSRQGLKNTAQQAREGSQKMKQAAQAAQDGKQQEAQQAGKQAESKMDSLDEEIRDQRQQMAEQMKAEVIDAINRALEETARLAQRQMAIMNSFQRGALVSQTRSDQGLVEEGAAKVMQQVAAASAKNALVSQQAGVAIGAARESMRQALESVSSASPNLREAADQAGEALDALAVAAFNLMLARDKVDGSQSGSGLQEAMEQMQQMAGKQGQLAQQGSGMMQQGQNAAEQMLQLAMQQRAVSQQLERMRAGGMMPGAGQMAKEAKDLARAIEAGQLNREVVDRQQRLFKRMLDAGRSLEGEEKDENKERQSTTAKDGNPHLPPGLDPRIRSGAGDVRLPGWETLQRLSPEERRRVMDYFRRLTGGGGQ